MIQPPGEPREQRIGEVRPKIFIKDKMTRMVDILRRKKWKKVQNEVTGPENVVFGKFNWKLKKIVLDWVMWLQFELFEIFLKRTRLYRPFRSFYLLWIFFVAQTFFFIVEKFNISAIYQPIILIFSLNLPLVFIYEFYQKKFKSNNSRATSTSTSTF